MHRYNSPIAIGHLAASRQPQIFTLNRELLKPQLAINLSPPEAFPPFHRCLKYQPVMVCVS